MQILYSLKYTTLEVFHIQLSKSIYIYRMFEGLNYKKFIFLIYIYICSIIIYLVTCTEQSNTTYNNTFCTFRKVGQNYLPTCCHWHLPTQNEVGDAER